MMSKEETAHLLAKLLNEVGYVVIATPERLSLNEVINGISPEGKIKMRVTGTATFEDFVKSISALKNGVDPNVYHTHNMRFYKVIMETTNDRATNNA